MCGICGYFTPNHTSENIISMMNKAMSHRGPDDSGEYYSTYADYQVAFGQARLSIIDLSPGGHQPMFYKDLVIVFNGEIYNYKEVKNELIQLGHEFKSGSDTEVILHAFDQWGKECVTRFIGMFAFVILNSKTGIITAFRDRSGSKPFYYYFKDGTFIFGSELKIFHQHPAFKKEINHQAIELYFKHVYVPAPHTIFKNTFKLESGSWLQFDLNKRELTNGKYWSITDVYSKPILDISYDEAKAELKKILVSACNYRMMADVPVGIFLSGGFDSNLVASIVQSSSDVPLNSFTIGFEEGNNEAPFAKETASYLGMNHTEYYCTQKEALDIINELPTIFDEPFADSSAIPTILVSRLASKQVKVALSSDAGDEVFVGYNRYVSLAEHIKTVDKIPNSLRGIASTGIKGFRSLVPESNMFLRHKLGVFANTLENDKSEDGINLIDGIVSSPPSILDILLKGSKNTYLTIPSSLDFSKIKDRYNAALAYDYFFYLQNDILTKVDKAAMSTSLEGREPLLDHRIVEFAAQLPTSYKYDGITTKRILKDIVYDYLPKEMMQRPKAGFSIPVNKWLKNELTGLIDQELNYSEMRKQGIFNVDFVETIISDFRNNKFFYELLIWKIVQFQMWYNRWMK
jgi:asparagine synthase (glutamine-hydrolysing)